MKEGDGRSMRDKERRRDGEKRKRRREVGIEKGRSDVDKRMEEEWEEEGGRSREGGSDVGRGYREKKTKGIGRARVREEGWRKEGTM